MHRCVTKSKQTHRDHSLFSMGLSYAVGMSWACFFLLGFGGWNVLNSLFLEAPLFAAALPEGADISTSLLIAQQIASVLVFVPTQIWQNGAQRFYPHIILSTLGLAIISCIILMIWSLDAVGGFSLPLLLMAVITSCIGYISTTYYFPFVSLFKGMYTNAYSLGLGFSLAFTAAMSLAQDSGAVNPRFGVEGFFGIILGSNCIAFLGAAWLIFSPTAKTQLVSYAKENGEETDSTEPVTKCAHQLAVADGTPMDQQVAEYEAKYPQAQPGHKLAFRSLAVLKVYWFPVVLQTALAFLAFGIVPGLLPYASSSYHNGSVIYMWSVSLLYLIDPFGRALYSLNVKLFSRSSHLAITTIACFAIGMFICILAFIAPWHVPGRDNKSGGGLPIALCCLFGWLYATSFTGSYTLMFNLGTECDSDTLYALQKQKKMSKKEQEVADKQDGKSSNSPSNSSTGSASAVADETPPQPEGDVVAISMTSMAKVEQQEPADVTLTKDEPCLKSQYSQDEPCPICARDSVDRDSLRQMIYRVAGLGLQIGSFVGTFVAAALTIFSGTLPDPIVPIFD